MPVRIGVSYIHDEQRGRTYLEAVRAAGAEPVVLAMDSSLPQWPTEEEARAIFRSDHRAVAQLDELDGLLLTGGGDIDPMLYREVIDGSLPPHWPRDHVETAQFHRARALNLPIFGICRGEQFINVALGGSLVQHLPTAASHRETSWKKSASHLVQVTADSVLARIIADGQPTEDLVVGVNSYHHQGVSRPRLAPGLLPVISSRVAEDAAVDLIEGFESVGTREGREYLVGVQWHPERVDDEAPIGAAQPVPFREISRRLFRAFVSAAEAARSSNQLRDLVPLEV
jgi:putative glutamine amidotransferase